MAVVEPEPVAVLDPSPVEALPQVLAEEPADELQEPVQPSLVGEAAVEALALEFSAAEAPEAVLEPPIQEPQAEAAQPVQDETPAEAPADETPLVEDSDELAAYRGLAPGWYRDSVDPSLARFWDGAALSEETRPIASSAPQEPEEVPKEPKGRRRLWRSPRPPAAEAGIFKPEADRPVGWKPEAPEPGAPTSASAYPTYAPRTSPEQRTRPMYQEPWILLIGLIIVLIISLLYVNGSSHSPSDASPTTMAPSTTTTTVPSTTTIPPTTAPTTPTTAPPAIPMTSQPNANSAANALVSAWARKDMAKAATVATAPAISTLFAVAYPGSLAGNRGCSTGSPPITCTFGPPGGGSPNDPIYSLIVSEASDGGWYVSSVQILAASG